MCLQPFTEYVTTYKKKHTYNTFLKEVADISVAFMRNVK